MFPLLFRSLYRLLHLLYPSRWSAMYLGWLHLLRLFVHLDLPLHLLCVCHLQLLVLWYYLVKSYLVCHLRSCTLQCKLLLVVLVQNSMFPLLFRSLYRLLHLLYPSRWSAMYLGWLYLLRQFAHLDLPLHLLCVSHSLLLALWYYLVKSYLVSRLRSCTLQCKLLLVVLVQSSMFPLRLR